MKSKNFAFIITLLTIVFISNVSAAQFNVAGDMNFGEVAPGETKYTDWITVTNPNPNVPLAMYLSGTNFYDSTSSLSICPEINELTLDNFAYYAEMGDYSTRDDVRADADGYIPIKYGAAINFNNIFSTNSQRPQAIIQSSRQRVLTNAPAFYPSNTLSNTPLKIKFRLNLPSVCDGTFDTGKILIWGAESETDYLGIPVQNFHVDAARSVDVGLIGDITYLDANGREFSPFVYRTGSQSTTYLSSGDHMVFGVEAFTPNGLSNIQDIFVTLGSNAITGNELVSNCYGWNNLDNSHIRATCNFQVGQNQGISQLGVEAELNNNVRAYQPIGSYFFNYAGCFADSECDDSNPQTIDRCVGEIGVNSRCSHTQLDTNTRVKQQLSTVVHRQGISFFA